MKQQNALSSYSVWQKLMVIFSFVSLILALILYIGTAVSVGAIVVLAAVNLVAALLYLFPGKSRRFVRILARVLLLLIPVVLFVLIAVYLSMLKQYEYVVSLEQSLLFFVVFGESSLFFATVAWSLPALKQRPVDLALGGICSLATLILSVITVVILAPLTDESGAYLLSMLFRNELYYGIFLFCTLLATVGYSGALVNAVKLWREQRDAKNPSRRR